MLAVLSAYFLDVLLNGADRQASVEVEGAVEAEVGPLVAFH